jgi:hypothetical protein
MSSLAFWRTTSDPPGEPLKEDDMKVLVELGDAR